MKLLLCVVVCAVTCVAQTFPGGGGVTPVTSLPALPCSNGKIATLTTGGVYNCVSGAWVLQQTAITGAPPNWPSLFAPSPHAQSHSGSGSDPITSTGPLTVNGTLSVGSGVPQTLTGNQQIDMVCSGDIGAALAANIATLDAASGGTIRLSAGACYATVQLSRSAGKNLRITGQGAYFDGTWSSSFTASSVGGTSLELRYASGPKIVSTGRGSLEIDHLTLYDFTDGTQPFFSIAWSSLKIHDAAIWGKTPNSPTQDAIVLGDRSTGSSVGAGAFQGYGAVITANYFSNIRRGVYLQKFANAVVVTNNTWSATCGGSSSYGAIEMDGIDTSDTGLIATGNLIEINHYVYGIRFTALAGRSTLNNNFYDPGVGTLAQYYFSSDSLNNTIITAEGQGFPVCADATSGATCAQQTIVDAYQNATNFGGKVAFRDDVTLTGFKLFKLSQSYNTGLYSDNSGNMFLRANAHDGCYLDQLDGRLKCTPPVGLGYGGKTCSAPPTGATGDTIVMTGCGASAGACSAGSSVALAIHNGAGWRCTPLP